MNWTIWPTSMRFSGRNENNTKSRNEIIVVKVQFKPTREDRLQHQATYTFSSCGASIAGRQGQSDMHTHQKDDEQQR